MDTFPETAGHRMLPVERKGDTLIVTPVGDLPGFSRALFMSELSRVVEFAKQPDISNVLVDLGGTNYLGSEMIGGMLQLRKHVDESGRMAFCGASPDMLAGLRIMRIDALVPFFDSRTAALKEITSESLRQKLQAHRRLLVAAGVLVVLVAGGWAAVETGLYQRGRYLVFGNPSVEDYLVVVAAWNGLVGEYEQMTAPQREMYVKRSQESLSAVIRRLERTKPQRGDPDYYLLNAANDVLQEIEGPGGGDVRSSIFEEIDFARRSLEFRSELHLPPPAAQQAE